MQLIWQYLRLIRFPMTLAPVGAFIVGMIQSKSSVPFSAYELASIIAMFCLSAATLAYNGYEDREIDARKGEPFAKERPRTALTVAITFYALCVVIAAFLSPATLFFFSLMAISTVFYSRFAVKIPAVKNVLAALLSSILVLMGALVSNGITTLNLVTTLVIFFAICAMEGIKDIEDVNADRGYRRTLPMILPLQNVRWVIGACLAGAVLVGGLFLATLLAKILFAVAASFFIMALFRMPIQITQHTDHLPRRLVYVGLWIGLVTFLIQAL